MFSTRYSPESFFKGLPDGRGRARADDYLHRVVGVTRLFRLVVDGAHHAAQQRERCAAVFPADVPDPALGEPRAEDRLDAHVHGREQCNGLGIAVGERKTVVEYVSRFVLPYDLGDDGEHAGAVVSDLHALGVACCA